MDTFFNSLDGRLRVSGMVADSIMMGIVNSAMEDAYKKSCSKEGDLERLNEKSRFCELATMQLDWCLKYLQEVVDSSIVEGVCDRKQLLSDLLETRDRIHNRLEETEIAIAEKDVELVRRKESELNLRLALQLKGEQVSYLHNALGVERVKNERVNEQASDKKVSADKVPDHVFSELECSLNQQISKIRCRLEAGRKIMTNLMQKIWNCSFDVVKSNTWYDVNSNGIKTLHEFHDMAQLNLDIEDMVIDTDILKAEIKSSFEKVENSISLFKTTIEEQNWAWNAEKEVVHVIVRNFMKDVQCTRYSDATVVHPLPLDSKWSDFMVDISSLSYELQELVPRFDILLSDGITEFRSQYNTLSRGNSGEKGDLEKIAYLREKNYLEHVEASKGVDNGIDTIDKKEESTGNPSKAKNVGNADGQPKANSIGSVADLIRNHESIIRTKSQEINWLKCELSREKSRHLCPKDDKTLASIREMIVNVIPKLENMEKYKMRMTASAHYDGSLKYERGEDTFLQNTSVLQTLNNESLVCEREKSNQQEFKMANQETKIICSSNKILEKEGNMSCNHLLHTELFDALSQVKEKNTEMEIEVVILEDTYEILFKSLLGKLHLASFDSETEMIVREDIYRVILTEIFMKYYDEGETHMMNHFLKEEIDKVVLRTMVEDVMCNDNKEIINRLEVSELRQTIAAVERLDSLTNDPIIYKPLKFVIDSQTTKSHFHEINGREIEESNEEKRQDVKVFVEKHNAFSCVNEKLEMASQQPGNIIQRGEQLISIYASSVEENNAVSDSVALVEEEVQDKNNSTSLISGSSGKQFSDIQVMIMPLEKFLQVISDFEVMVFEKIRGNLLRLQVLGDQFIPITKRLNLIKRNELLYRKAFTRRCYDLQTAEAEVDLLGDQVDVLFDLVIKVQKTLNYYLPILQHYSGPQGSFSSGILMDDNNNEPFLHHVRKSSNREAG